MPGSSTVALGNHPIQIPSDFPGILKQYTKVGGKHCLHSNDLLVDYLSVLGFSFLFVCLCSMAKLKEHSREIC